MSTPSRPAGPWARCVVYGLGDQKEWSNDFWYTIYTGTPSSTWDEKLAATAFYNQIVPYLLGNLVPTWQVLGLQFYYNNGTGTIGYSYYNAQQGTYTSISGTYALPEDVAVVVQKKTTNATKDGRGRWYVTGCPQPLANASYLTPAGISAYQLLAVSWKASIVDQGVTWAPAHYSRKLNTLFPLLDDPVISQLATRRRRRFRF